MQKGEEIAALLDANYSLPITFRAHPLSPEDYKIKYTQKSPRHMPLHGDLKGAAFCVTFNSNVGVEAVLAGIPTITMDEGAIATDVTSHSIYNPYVYPNRWQWAYDLAYKQWTIQEIRSGTAWDHLKVRYK